MMKLFFLLSMALAVQVFAAEAPVATSSGPKVTTFSGSGGGGYNDGWSNQAWFNDPYGLAVDAAGYVYVADMANGLIRKVDPKGIVSTVAGSWGSKTFGTDAATGKAVGFNGPIGVAVDAAGNLYVAESVPCLIRKIDPQGVVSILAGSNTSGKANGAGKKASFNDPYSVAVDAAGNVYVADYGNDLIRKVTPEGVVTTLAGSGASGAADGKGTAASFHGPTNLAVDAAGNIYVSDTGNQVIRKVTPEGVVTTFAGSAGTPGYRDGNGGLFKDPSGLAFDKAGNLYVADAGNSLIRKVTPTGVVSTLAGTAGKPGKTDGIGTAASFYGPFGIAVDNAGNVYVADTGNNLIRKITP